jgi:hypothetical protein
MNHVAGESHHEAALRELTGPPRANGYLVPVEVVCVREPRNEYDRNAFRVEVGGRQVGHLRATIAAQLAPALDRTRCSSFTVCGVLRGGSRSARNVGVHVWLDRRTTPGPVIQQLDHGGEVSWPPHHEEGSDSVRADEEIADADR